MSRSKNRKIADLISGGTFDDGVVAASEVTGLHSVASTGNFNELSNKPAPFDPATLASVAVSGSFNDLSDQPTPFDPSTLGTASTQATGAFATAAQGAKADAALPKAGGAVTGNVTFGYNDRAVFGVSGNALEVFHDGSNKYIVDSGSGSLFIRGSDLVLEDASGNDYITMNDAGTGGTVTLKHNSSSKLATTSTGVDVTGTVNADALTGIGSIDATTKNAIAAAGVGGATTVLIDNASVSSGSSTLEIDFTGGYDRYIISISNLTISTSGTYDGQLWGRFKNSSNTPITVGSDYTYAAHKGSTYNQGNTSSIPVHPNYNKECGITMKMDVWYPYSTTRPTAGEWWSIATNTNGLWSENRGVLKSPKNSTSAVRHNSLYLFEAEGRTFQSGTYSVWGVNS